MTNKHFNKPYVARTGKDIRRMIDAKNTPAQPVGGATFTGSTELALAQIWSSLLGHANFGPQNEFFAVGGNSLKAVQMVSRIAAQLHVEVKLADIFYKPTIEILSAFINGLQTTVSHQLIIPQSRPERIPLSFSQERLWFIDQLSGSQQYHLPAVLSLHGQLHTAALAGALQEVVSRHQAIRTVIRQQDGQPYQVVKETAGWHLQEVDCSLYQDDRQALQQYLHHYLSQPFDLSTDYPLRAVLLRLQETEYVLAVVLHHIASDGYSTPVLVRELVELYNSAVEERPAALPVLPVQYADYALWQRNYLQGDVLAEKLHYWKEQLQDVATLQLPTDYSRPPVQSTRGAITSFQINKDLSDQLQALSQQHGVTLFMTLLSAFNVLLYRYSGQADICVGTPTAGREQAEVEGLIGFFVNTLALRSQVDGSQPFTQLLQQVKQMTLAAYEHQQVPFEKVVEAVVKERDMSRSPLFQVMLVLQNTPEVAALHLNGISVSAGTGIEGTSTHHTAKFDLTFNVTETAEGLYLAIEYSTDLYRQTTVERMAGHYINLLQSVVTAPQQSLGTLPMLSQAEGQQLLDTFNNTQATYPKDQTIVDLLQQQAASTPEKIAVVFEEQRLTYKELDERSNQLAHYLREKGVREETLVPICIERSIAMLTGIIGILKAGGAYVPIDPQYPQDRISYMLQDTKAGIVVSSRQSKEKLATEAGAAIEVIEIDNHWDKIGQQPATNVQAAITFSTLAYVIYTSGSTGTPKGVMIEHGNVYAFICWCQQEFAAGPFDIAYATTSICFDLSVFELFYPLSTGKPVRILQSGLHIGDYLSKDAGVLINTVPSVVQSLLQQHINLSNISILNMAGEPIPASVQQGLNVEQIEVRNLYGPTEDTTYSTVLRLQKDKLATIGKPIANTQIYILGTSGELLPAGVAGEIYISGAGVARGYLNQSSLTKEKFVANPFTQQPGARMYKTGDMGRWLADGNIEYLGRGDDQVKIRGYRIELGEIETVVQQHTSVKQAVVIARDNEEGSKQLVGYVVAGEGFSKEAITAYLAERLPDYMVPQLWVTLDSLPLTPNGKINRKALPNVDAGELLNNDFVAPRNETEQALADIWKEMLLVEKAGIHDNFFELGGHSLLAMRLVSLIQKKWTVEISIRQVFSHPTIAALANHVTAQKKGLLLPQIEPANPRPAQVPLSFSQERLWFIHRMEGSLQYHLPAVLRLHGYLNVEALEYAFTTVVTRHESLRSNIHEAGGKAYQEVVNAQDWKLIVQDGTAYSDEALNQAIRQLVQQPFNLSQEYKMRAALIQVAAQEQVLVVTLHHIASDGLSLPIVVNEVTELYTAFTENRPANLSQLPVQYADYAIWQRAYLQGEVLEEKLAYWKEKLDGIASLQLPTDFARPAVQSTRGANTKFSIDKKLAEQLHELSHQQGVTLFMTLLAGFNILLQRYSSQDDVCIGTPIAGRNQQEIEPLVGFFINTLSLRSDISNNPVFTSLLQQVKKTTIEAYEYGDVPFEKVVEAVNIERDTSKNPLFQVLLSMQTTLDISGLHLGETTLTVQEYQNNASQLDIICNITETGNGLEGDVMYCTDLYTEQTIERMMAHYRQLLSSIVQSPDQQISSLSMLRAEEEQQLLVEFNDTAAGLQQKTVIALFEEQVAKTPGNTAIVFEQDQLTYQQLNNRANQLAHYLKARGVQAEQLIPVCIERSPEMLVAILGILKAGAAYVPVDPAYPQERISYLLEDTQATLIITDGNSEAQLPEDGNARIIIIDEDDRLPINLQSTGNPDLAITPQQLAYVIYTSGSTGRPKGVLIEHGSLSNYLVNSKTDYINEAGTMAGSFVHLSYTFDASLTALFMPLLSGKSVIMAATDSLNIFEDSNLQQQAPYDFIKITPAHLPLLQPYLKLQNGGLLTQKLVIGGEALLQSHFDVFVEEGINVTIINEYGPTEATVGCSVYSFATLDESKNNTAGKSISIGKPVDNATLYILGSNQELLPIGVPGELYISGAGLARGYLHQPQLTAEKFIANPFSTESGAKLYKTGDRASWSADGTINYLGRRDEQVKIRGYRIELGEVESVLQQQPFIKQAVVLAKENKDGSKRLVAYIVPAETDNAFDKEEAIANLKMKLPEYMIPVQWAVLDALPLTVNGKVDRKALPDPGLNLKGEKQYVAPQTETEKILVTIWQDLLEVETVGIHDNFFELGGHSLIVIKMLSVIKNEFNLLIPIQVVFKFSTIREMADYIDWETGSDDEQRDDATAFELINI